MGIHGLTSFIDKNSHLLKDYQLHDCRVVIDGNNLFHFLYFYCKVRFQYGGDYDVFQRKISMIFSMFKTCNIEVFVVFDGAYSVDGRKHKTTMRRAMDKVHAAQRIMYGDRGALIPCLAQQTFRQTLDELGIHHVTCDFEADNQLVTLANMWNCPVMSNDSDFYIFDLKGGFIPLDYIHFQPCEMEKSSDQSESERYFLPVQYYHVEEFIRCFKSLNRSVLPLFACMLGNDYINASAFEALYQKTKKVACKHFSAPKKNPKIISVLYWLEEMEHKQQLVSEVLGFVKADRRQKVEKWLTDSINGYTDTQDFESFDLKAFLEGDRSAALKKTDLVISQTQRGNSLPSWFVTACRCGDIPVFLLNAALVHRIILPTQVESISLPAASMTSRDIRKIVYGLLLGPDPALLDTLTSVETQPQQKGACNTEVPVTERSSISDPCAVSQSVKQTEWGVVEYTRNRKELWRLMVNPCLELPIFGKICLLENVPSLSMHERETILLETLGVTSQFSHRFDPAIKVFVISLLFWVRKSDPLVSLHQLEGLVLSAILLHVHKEIWLREKQMVEQENKEAASGTRNQDCGDGTRKSLKSAKTGPASVLPAHSETTHSSDFILKTVQAAKEKGMDKHPLSVTGVCQSEDLKVLTKVRDNLKKYYQDPAKICSKNPPVHEIFHGNAQFQACLLEAVHLNSLLMCPLPNPQPATLFNGTFVYTIVRELKIRSNPDRFMLEMLMKDSALMRLFTAICSEVVQEAGEGVFAVDTSEGKKCCKSSKKKKKENASASHKQHPEDVGSLTLDDGGKQEMVAACDLSNRFHALQMDEDS